MRIDEVTYISASSNVVRNKSINGLVTDKGMNYTIISSSNGIIKLPFIDGLAVNQKISIGLYDIPDRANMVKFEITVPNIAGVNDAIYQFLVRKDNIYPRSTSDIVDVTEDNVKQNSYKLSAISSSGDLVNINLELHNEGNDRIFLSGDNIYVKASNRLYKITGEVDNLKNILSSGEKAVTLAIVQDFNLKGNIDRLLEIVASELPSRTTATSSNVESNDYSAIYRWGFLSIFKEFSKAKVQLRESRGSCKSFRLIFELEDSDRILILVDCLYIPSSATLTIVIRSEVLLSDNYQSKFTNIFRKLLHETALSGSISFVVQSSEVLRQILARSDCGDGGSYTYRV